MSVLVMTSCENELKRTPIGDGKFETSEKLNDSIVLIKTYNSNEKLEAKDYENIRTKIHKLYYYNEKGKLTEAGVGFSNKENTNFSYVDCRYFESNNGKMMYRKILNTEAQTLAHYYYDSVLNLKRQVFYNESSKSIRSEISFNKNGTVNNEYSSYLTIKKNGDRLFFYPSWYKGIHKEAIIMIYTLEGTEIHYEKEISFKNTSELILNLKNLDTSKIYSIAVFAQQGYREGLPLLVPSSILIDDLNNIPTNNLYPVIIKDGQMHSGKYLLEQK